MKSLPIRLPLLNINEEYVKSIMHRGVLYDLHINPGSLNAFQSHVRGIITKDGDLYIADTTWLTHGAIVGNLNAEGIISVGPNDPWGDDPKGVGFLTTIRSGETENLYIGRSNRDAFDSQKDWIIETLDKAKSKNPNINFIPEIE